MEIAAPRVDEEVLAHRPPAEQHPKCHLVSSCQVHQGFDLLAGDDESGPDDRSDLRPASRILHLTLANYLSLTGDTGPAFALAGVDVEPDHLDAVDLESLDVEGVERRVVRPGIDLGLDLENAQVGE